MLSRTDDKYDSQWFWGTYMQVATRGEDVSSSTETISIKVRYLISLDGREAAYTQIALPLLEPQSERYTV